MAGISCALPCQKASRSLPDLRGVVPDAWAKLSQAERASWTGMIAARSCVVGASCDSVCDGEYPAPATVVRRGEKQSPTPAP